MELRRISPKGVARTASAFDSRKVGTTPRVQKTSKSMPRNNLNPTQSISFWVKVENVGSPIPIVFSALYIISRTRKGNVFPEELFYKEIKLDDAHRTIQVPHSIGGSFGFRGPINIPGTQRTGNGTRSSCQRSSPPAQGPILSSRKPVLFSVKYIWPCEDRRQYVILPRGRRVRYQPVSPPQRHRNAFAPSQDICGRQRLRTCAVLIHDV